VNQSPKVERRLLRRGLLAGVAGLFATALMKASGANKAQAANGDPWTVGGMMTGTATTQLTVPIVGEPSLVVLNGSNVDLEVRAAIHGAAQAGSAGSTASSVGVAGYTGNSGINARGVYGSSASGIGVRGFTGNLYGVEGQASSAGGIGVRGVSTSNFVGVRGVSNTFGDFDSDGNGSGIGVFGKSSSGTGVRGECQTGTAVSGGSPQSVGVFGASDTNVGVRGLSSSFVGVVGVSTSSNGIYASNSAPFVPALYAENLSSAPLAGYFQGGVVVAGNFHVMGVKAAAVPLTDGSHATMYCQESPEPYFEDFGRGQLISGAAQIALERDFASMIQAGGYMVFLTPSGDCNGLFVTRQNSSGFEVRESKGGTTNVTFTYRVVAKRKDIPGPRLERLDPRQLRNVEGMKQMAREKLATPPGAPPPWQPSANPGAGRPASVPPAAVPEVR
jgi:hypothetical protein